MEIKALENLSVVKDNLQAVLYMFIICYVGTGQQLTLEADADCGPKNKVNDEIMLGM